VSASSLGALLGVVLASRIDDVVAFVERAVGAHLFDPSVYFITRLPSDLQWQMCAWCWPSLRAQPARVGLPRLAGQSRRAGGGAAL
jgi:hypothetical protein